MQPLRPAPNIFARPEDQEDAPRRPGKLVLTDQSRGLLETLRQDAPGYSLDDPYRQVQAYTGIIYLAIKAICRGVGGSTVQLMRERDADGDGEDDAEQGDAGGSLGTLAKALPTAHANASDEKWVPVTDHPFCKILERPNPRDSWSKFQSRAVIQYHLTGRALIWGVPNGAGKPAELWVLPTAMCQPGYRR